MELKTFEVEYTIKGGDVIKAINAEDAEALAIELIEDEMLSTPLGGVEIKIEQVKEIN